MIERESMSFEHLLKRLDVDLLTEQCPYCQTYHPRYLLRFQQQEPRSDLSVTESVPFFLQVLGFTEDGKRQLAVLIEYDGTRLLDPENHLPYAAVIDRTVEQPYTCETRMEQARVAYQEAMKRTDAKLVRRMKRVLAMLSPLYKWERHWQRKKAPPDLEEEVRACCRIDYVNGGSQEEREQEEPIPQRECGSAEVADTPKALYRLFYLFRPAHLSFEDMYRECLMVLSTPNRRFSVAIHFYKYELGLYFFAEAALVHDEQEGHWMQARAGVPGADNGLSLQHEEGLLFFQMIRMALDRPWPVYPGNDFEV